MGRLLDVGAAEELVPNISDNDAADSELVDSSAGDEQTEDTGEKSGGETEPVTVLSASDGLPPTELCSRTVVQLSTGLASHVAYNTTYISDQPTDHVD